MLTQFPSTSTLPHWLQLALSRLPTDHPIRGVYPEEKNSVFAFAPPTAHEQQNYVTTNIDALQRDLFLSDIANIRTTTPDPFGIAWRESLSAAPTPIPHSDHREIPEKQSPVSGKTPVLVSYFLGAPEPFVSDEAIQEASRRADQATVDQTFHDQGHSSGLADSFLGLQQRHPTRWFSTHR